MRVLSGRCVSCRQKSSYDESSKTYSNTKSSGGNWTYGSGQGGVHEVTHRCETISHNNRFFCSHYCAENGELFSGTYHCRLAISIVQNVYDATNILSVD